MKDNETVTIERPPLLVDLIIQKLKTAIVTTQLTHGDRLKEERLAEDYQISRTPLREALMKLEFLGFVKRRTNGGWEVASLDYGKVLGQYELKTLIEVNAVLMSDESSRLSISKDIKTILPLMEKAVNSEDMHQYRKLDFDFHKTLVKYYHNNYVREVYTNLMSYIEWMRNLSIYPCLELKKSYEDHLTIAKAIDEGKASYAGQMLYEHLKTALDKIKENLQMVDDQNVNYASAISPDS